MSAWKNDMPLKDMSYMVKYFYDTSKYVPGLPKKVMNKLLSEIREYEKLSTAIHFIPWQKQISMHFEFFIPFA